MLAAKITTITMLVLMVLLSGCTAPELQALSSQLRQAQEQTAETSLHLAWTWPETGSGLLPHVAASKAGVLYTSDTEGVIHALKAPGEELWNYVGDCGGAFPPILSPNEDRLYFVSDKSNLCAVSLDGELIWKAQVDGLISPLPHVTPNGMVHVRTTQGAATIAPSGEVVQYPLPDFITSIMGSNEIPTAGNDGLLYLPLPFRTSVAVFTEDYELLRECDVETIRSNVVANSDQGFMITITGGELAAFDPACSELWRISLLGSGENPDETTGDEWFALATDNDVLYAGGSKGRLLAVATDDGRILWQHPRMVDGSDILNVAVGDNVIAVAGNGPPVTFAYDLVGKQTLAQPLYKLEQTGYPIPLAGDGIAAVEGGRLQVYNADPTMVVATPSPVPPPVDQVQAESEIAEFMLNMIVESEIVGTLEYVEQTGGQYTGPTANLIYWSPIPEEGQAADAAHPIRAWTYADGELTEEPDAAKAIDDYNEQYVNAEVQQNIFAWGLYSFEIRSIDPDLQGAEVELSASCGPLCGHGMIYTLKRAPDGAWFVSNSEQTWIS